MQPNPESSNGEILERVFPQAQSDNLSSETLLRPVIPIRYSHLTTEELIVLAGQNMQKSRISTLD